MTQTNTTPVPNSLFDVHLKKLKSAELKVLLVIIRQTLGWADRRTQLGRKEKDWISSRQLQSKTGSSRRAISSATENLIREKLIEVLDERGNQLHDPQKRQGKLRLFYRLSTNLNIPVENECTNAEQLLDSGPTYAKFADDLRKKRQHLAQKTRITKETLQN